jgi:hypothetical membrane protein
MGKCRLTRLSLLCGILAPAMIFAVIIVVGQITPHYDPLRETISRMGAAESPYAAWLNGGYVLYSSLIALTVYGFFISFRHDRRVGLLTALLGVHALGAMLLAVVTDIPDLSGADHSSLNPHNIVSALAYLPIIGAAFVFYRINMRVAALRAVSLLGLVVIFVNIPMPIITQIDAISPISGLLQRLFYAVTFSWLAFASWLLFRRAGLAAANAANTEGEQGKSYRINRTIPTALSDLSYSHRYDSAIDLWRHSEVDRKISER